MPPDEKEADYQHAKTLVIQSQNPSIAFLQRSLRLGYGAATRLMAALETDGVVTPPDGHGFRRLTSAFERTPTEVFNNWRVFGQDKDAPIEGELVDVSGAIAAVRPYSPSQVCFYPESGLPWIEVTFPGPITPATVIGMGLELEHALQLPVYLASLQLRKVEYLVEGSFLLGHRTTYDEDHFKSVRLPLTELGQLWNVIAPATTS